LWVPGSKTLSGRGLLNIRPPGNQLEAIGGGGLKGSGVLEVKKVGRGPRVPERKSGALLRPRIPGTDTRDHFPCAPGRYLTIENGEHAKSQKKKKEKKTSGRKSNENRNT